MLELISPNWSAPSHIKAFSTTRINGVSTNVYQGLNLGLHVEDKESVVLQNRALLLANLSLETPFCWLNQTHSTLLLKINKQSKQATEADASWTDLKDQVCVVMTADCLPLLITDKQGSFVSAIHAGWRGLCDGIIEKTIATICRESKVSSSELLVWLGPCIGKTAFEVGAEVRDEFIQHDTKAVDAFSVHKDRYLADLQALARLRIAPFKVAEISASPHCTFSEADLFYSYRRDGKTGRMATLIYIKEPKI
ncbi:peptidoglycan editing factor PgeF [Psychromonas sp. Urea-02u-13]|uniref:peptidoglycan editing factor PgeF n=1 Tax=Psychromonas sp. Urea-02u-13 TaxID=2058326 RepID=UPI000C346F31|nr:peptidoglycan editing factor PgeF [Psychromonas sp. Urea-02u-13]PKG40789.1 peptidoglycan editing factor PgeF [Psychromonas sp. Urea-02u-13]